MLHQALPFVPPQPVSNDETVVMREADGEPDREEPARCLADHVIGVAIGVVRERVMLQMDDAEQREGHPF
jgi:hypothetical protein